MCQYHILPWRQSRPKITYDNVPYICDVSCTYLNLWPFDTCYTKKGLIVIGRNNINRHKHPEPTPPGTLHEIFASLPQSIRDIVGHISLPPDDGRDLLLTTTNNSKSHIFGASDTSFKAGKASHAWVLSSGSVDDLSNPLQNISRGGVVHGHPSLLSSGRGELQGILALSIVADIFEMHHESTAPVTLICDDKGVTNKCITLAINNLRSQRNPNVDLYINQQHLTKQNSITHEWVRGHSDKGKWNSIQDLRDQGLNRDEIYNVWCDKLAKQFWSSSDAADHKPEATPVKKWAIYSSFSTPHKTTGSLSEGVYSCLGYLPLLSYVCQKQDLSIHHMELINLEALHHFIITKPYHTRAAFAKLIHNWIPTHAHLSQQGHEHLPLCPRCNNTIETSSHVLVCSNPNGIKRQTKLLYSYLKSTHLPPDIYNSLISTIWSQNLIGWDSFLKGFIAKSWKNIFEAIDDLTPHITRTSVSNSWDYSLTALTLSLY